MGDGKRVYANVWELEVSAGFIGFTDANGVGRMFSGIDFEVEEVTR
jgi:hypothetical protein